MTREELDRLYSEAGRRYNVDPRLLRAIALVESSERPDALGPAVTVNGQSVRAVGMMQFIPSTARALGIDPRDPRQAVMGAARLMSQHIQDAGDQGVEEALRLYYAGPSMRNRGPRTQAYPGLVAARFRQLPAYQPQQANTAPPEDNVVLDILMGRSPGPARAEIPLPPEIRQEIMNDFDEETADLFDELTARNVPPPQNEPAGRRVMSMRERLGEGFVRGVRDVVDTPAEWLAGSRLGRFVGPIIGAPSAEEVAAGNRSSREAFARDLQPSGAATIGRIAGNVAGALGPTGVAAGAARAGTSLIPGMAGRLAQGSSGAGSLSTNLAARMGQRGIGGAAGGATGGYLLASPEDDLGNELATGAGLGAGIAMTLNPLIGATAQSIRNATRGEVSRQRAMLARRALQLGIPIYGPQLSSSPAINALDRHLRLVPGSGHEARTGAGREAFTREVARLIGENSPRIDSATRLRAAQRIGRGFDNVARGRVLDDTSGRFGNDLAAIERDMLMTPLPEASQRALRNIMENLMARMPGSRMSGDDWVNVTRHGTPLGMALRSNDDATRQYAGRIREALNDLLEQNAPDMAQNLRELRSQYRNLNFLVRPATKGVEGSVDGLVDPRAFADAVRRQMPNVMDQPVGTNPIGDLANIGLTFNRPAINSNNPFAAATFLGLPGLSTAAAGMAYGIPSAVGAGLAGAAVGGGTANLLSRYLASPGYRDSLIRQGTRSPYQLPPPPSSLTTPAVNAGAVSASNQDFNAPSPIGQAQAATLPDPNLPGAPLDITVGGQSFYRTDRGQGMEWVPLTPDDGGLGTGAPGLEEGGDENVIEIRPRARQGAY